MTEAISYCSFCDKHKDKVEKLIVSHKVAICNECVDLCKDLIQDARKITKSKNNLPSLDPQEIKNYLDQYVVGQDQAKVVLSVAIANHYKRIGANKSNQEVAKANVLIIGPTGTGKTLMAKMVAQYLDVPFVIADATCLTEAGYVGDDVETLIARLYQNANGDIAKTQRGIIFLDEVDKIGRKSEAATVSRDVSGEGVQQALLKLVEGTRCKISNSLNKKGSDTVEIDTSNILFIAGGAFVGLDNIIKNRVKGTSIGFGASVDEPTPENLHNLTPDDLVKFGMIPEFIGRFPTAVCLDSLDKSQLINILTKVRHNFVEQYQWLFEQDGVMLEFNSDGLDLIAERTLKSQTGARGLHSELERVLMPHMFNLPKYRNSNILRVVIDKDLVNTPRTILQENE